MFVWKDGLGKFIASFALVVRHSVDWKSEKNLEVLEKEEEDNEAWYPGNIDDLELVGDIPGCNG